MRVLLVVVVKVMLLMLHGKARLAGVTPEEDGADERLAGPEQAADAIGDGGARPGPGPGLRQRRRRRGCRRRLRRRQQ